ncbi:MAG: super-infection exclusion protein B [Candidatus Phlomobacter fragariae]
MFFSCSYVLAQLITVLIAGVKRRLRYRITRSTRHAVLNTLTPKEVGLIKYMIDSGELVELPTRNETVQALRKKGIIERYHRPEKPSIIYFIGDDEQELFKIVDAYKSDFLY